MYLFYNKQTTYRIYYKKIIVLKIKDDTWINY